MGYETDITKDQVLLTVLKLVANNNSMLQIMIENQIEIRKSLLKIETSIDDGSLDIVKSKTGRIFVKQDLIKEQKIVIYSRVSSSENKSNLDSQADRLLQYCNAKGYKVHDIIKEVGSGLNDDRKKLIKILKDPSITKIVVEHKDRLTRFGFNYIKILSNAEIEVVNNVDNNEQDLMQDFVSLVTSFCARLYGRRRTRRVTEKLINSLTNDSK